MYKSDQNNKNLGNFGENIAKRYLLQRGYTIIDQNQKRSYQEIDIIAKIGKINVFVEVKTRRLGGWQSATEALGPKKIKNLKKFRRQVICGGDFAGEKVRFDFIDIDFNEQNKTAKISHFKEIF